MKKAFFFIGLCVFIFLGCSSQTVSEQEEIEEQTPELLENSGEGHVVSAEEASENEMLKAAIANYQKAIKSIESETEVIRNNLSLFSLEKIKKDDHMGELVVTDMKIEKINGFKNQYVAFEGILEVEGKLVLNQGGTGWKYLFLVEEDLRSIPHSFHDLEKGRLVVTIANEAELEAALGEKLGILDENNRLKITALFKNYNYIYAENTDLLSNIMFQALMSVNEF